MNHKGHDDELEALLAEQVAYYRARAPEYAEGGIPELGEEELTAGWHALNAEIERFAPTGDVLELACGPGTWTELLLRHASTLTVVDASPEMLALAAEKVHDERVRFIEADLFDWRPDRTYDVVFFGFWLSHVPLERFESFWATVGTCLGPGGGVLFVDDAFRTDDELIEGPESATIRRHLNDGTEYRAVKVPHTPAGLERRIADLGWRVSVEQMPGPFFCGAATPP
ncbi:MAG TPA: class I SAM-dependent methyltransferase [Solirubrobacteraceae bacterium]|jgi:demethylmenaquinone methyltransferase/2-methoxy-6-polyprenyl-1,4-benzoquinol methylase